MRATLAQTMLAVAARRHLAAVDLRHALERLGPRLRDDTGAQAAEYAMLGGVSAAACSALMVLLRNKDTLSRVIEAVLTALGKFIGSWF